MRYPVVIHKDSDSNYGVTVPDLPGCFSAGETLDEALDQTVEAIECHLEGLLTDGEVIPIPRTLEHHRSNPDYEGGVWAVVTIAERNIGQKILDGIREIKAHTAADTNLQTVQDEKQGHRWSSDPARSLLRIAEQRPGIFVELAVMEINGYRAVVQYDPEIEMFRGEFIGLNGGADFYATDIEGVHREGEISLKVFFEMCREDGVEPK